jgi:hypothetical protein
LVLGLVALVTLSACASPVVVSMPSIADSLANVPRGEPLFCLPPYLTFELAPSERRVAIREEDRVAVERLMTSTTARKLGESGFRVLTIGDMQPDRRRAVEAVLGGLGDRHEILARSYKDKSELSTELRRLAEATGTSTVCLQWLRVRIGKGGGYNLWSGAVWAGTHSSDVRVVLLSLENGRHLWARRAFVHALPLDSEFATALEALFAGSGVTGSVRP